jgi:hypothetical protein
MVRCTIFLSNALLGWELLTKLFFRYAKAAPNNTLGWKQDGPSTKRLLAKDLTTPKK